jgi:hypothetical protein
MITIRAANGQGPGLQLHMLLKELLDADRPKLETPRAFVARFTASWILAQDDRIGTRELARMVNTSQSSVSNWRNDIEFKKEIERRRQYIERAKIEGSWPPCTASEDQRGAAPSLKQDGDRSPQSYSDLASDIREALRALVKSWNSFVGAPGEEERYPAPPKFGAKRPAE